MLQEVHDNIETFHGTAKLTLINENSDFLESGFQVTFTHIPGMYT